MRRPLSVVLSRLPFKRPFLIGVAALLLVSLVGAAVWWQVGAHASPVNQVIVSDTNTQFSTVTNQSGPAVYPFGNDGCNALDGTQFCTGGGWVAAQTAMPGAHWIWQSVQWDPSAQGGNPVTFTRQFSVPVSASGITGHISIIADNGYDLQVNGTEMGSAWHTLFTQPDTYDLSALLKPGSNVITAEVVNDTRNLDPVHNPVGLIFRADVSYISDSTPPTTTATLDRAPDSNGWYHAPVTVTLQATDPDDASSTLQTNYSINGTTWLAYTVPVVISTDAQYNLQYRSVDQAGNLEAIQTKTFNIDQTPPDLHVTGAANQSYNVCSTDRPTRPTFAPTDALSGLDGSQGDSWTTPATATGAGVYTYSAHAKDVAGNSATDSRTYKVLYGTAFSGLMDPFKAGQTNTANLGATIPLKFQLLCNGTPISTAVASLSVKQGTGTAATTQPKKLSTVNTFAYDPTSQQYQLNVSTGSGYTNPTGNVVTFAAGTWTFTVTLDDGVSYDYVFQLS